MKKNILTVIGLFILLSVGVVYIQLNKKSMTMISISVVNGVTVLQLDGGIDRKGFRKFDQSLNEAEKRKEPIIIRLNCPGGEVSSSIDLCRRLLSSKSETYCLVQEAIATGLWVCASTDKVYFLPEGVAAGVIPVIRPSNSELEKIETKMQIHINDFISELAEAKSHDKKMLLAMMDDSQGFEANGKVWKNPGEILTLSAKEAEEIGLSSGTVVDVNALVEIIKRSDS